MESMGLGVSEKDISSGLVDLPAGSYSVKLKGGPVFKKSRNDGSAKMVFLYAVAEGKYAGAPIVIDFPLNHVNEED